MTVGPVCDSANANILSLKYINNIAGNDAAPLLLSSLEEKYNLQPGEHDYPFTAFIESLKTHGVTILYDENGLDLSGTIRIPPHTDNITITTGVEPRYPDVYYLYSFRLLGDESEFSSWSAANSRTYHNLKSGSYSLIVRVRNSSGFTTQTQIATLRIPPPWYRSWWAYLIYFLLSILLINSLFRIRKNNLTKQKKRLEREVQIRTNLLLEQAQELKQQKEKYKQANEIKTRLLRFAAHDLRNPLSAIQGYSRMLETEDDPHKSKEYASVISEISQKMYIIVQHMLASGARDEDSLALDFEEVNVRKLLHKIEKQFVFFLKDKKQTLSIEVEDQLPDILADEVRISEVLENLLSNAIKFSPAGSEITINAVKKRGLRDNKPVVSITVSDMGPGFSEKDQALAFREFQTLSAKPTSSESSTGLGLFIVKQLVAAHDGRINVKNNHNGPGTAISVVLPAILHSEPATDAYSESEASHR